MKRILSFTSGTSEPLCKFLQHRIERCLEGHNSQLTTNFCAYMYARRYLYIFSYIQTFKDRPRSPNQDSRRVHFLETARYLGYMGAFAAMITILSENGAILKATVPLAVVFSRMVILLCSSSFINLTMSSTDINSVYVNMLSSTPRKLYNMTMVNRRYIFKWLVFHPVTFAKALTSFLLWLVVSSLLFGALVNALIHRLVVPTMIYS